MKGRILLVHWREAEAEILAKEIMYMGWTVDVETNDGDRVSQRLRDNPADMVVIYLTRLPSHGRRTGTSLKEGKSTSNIPLVYVDGTEEAVERTRSELPDAVYTTTEELDHTLTHLSSPP